jgi:hypothetical protein
MGVWHCAIDDRSPQQLSTPNQPGDAGVMGVRAPPGTPVSPTGDASDTGSAGAGGAGTGGADSGGTPGAAGSSNAGTAGNAGSAAGAGGSTAMGTSGASGSSGIDPLDPFGFGTPSANSTCPAFAACGGELEGVWAYSDICADPSGDSLELLQVACPTGSIGVEPGGASTLSFASGQVSRQGAPQGDSVITFPRECVQDLGCAELAALVGDAGQCSDVNGDCICRTPASVDWSTQPYVVSGSQLTLQDGRSFDYCVQGDRLIYRETGMAQEPGTFTLQRN